MECQDDDTQKCGARLKNSVYAVNGWYILLNHFTAL